MASLRGPFLEKEDLRETTVAQSLMVSVGVSQLRCTELIFVDLGAKSNGQHYRGCSAAKTSAGNTTSFWKHVHFPTRRDIAQDIELLRLSTPEFIVPDMWPPNSPDLNQLDYTIWSVMQQRVYQIRVHDIDEL